MNIKKILLTFVLAVSTCHLWAIAEKKITIIIASYNNKDWYERNLDSVISQDYQNYHIVYINDCSPDGTGQFVADYIERHQVQDLVTLIDNKQRVGALANFYRAIHACDDNTIVVMLDGDDWFKNAHVLTRINEEYINPCVWLTYGQFEEYPSGKQGFCKKMPTDFIEAACYRHATWLTSHPRTFYAALFKKIRLEDLVFEGKFFPVTWDLALMFPMLEMAADHAAFIPDVLYEYNMATPNNDCKKRLIEQLHCDHSIRTWKKYARIATPFSEPAPATTALIIISDNPDDLGLTLRSTRHQLTGITTTYVLYKAPDAQAGHTYKQLTVFYPYAHFVALDSTYDPCSVVSTCLREANCSYVLFAHDGCTVHRSTDITQCITHLEATHAYGFYLCLGKNSESYQGLKRPQHMPSLINVWSDIYAWRFADGEYAWRSPQTTSLALYRTTDIEKKLSHENNTQWLWHRWSYLDNEHGIGLCFEKAPATY